MTARSAARVGDQIRDVNADRSGIVTDMSDGTYVLRPVHGGGTWWTVSDPTHLEVTMTREQRAAEGRV
ncbi:regulatory protein [Streptomyces albus]|uniref:Regulatory protein n=1 Tax=Streptomyces albus (strain ATCC 21838 / DSM 41398 / FERM P-419 / JCM 4703 / NBRC 107858) TaxID=1081613 RepID=A0A0B5EZ09_STRA4|nr:regulatory protein [Streptomyces albus]AOU78155.1 regulatory protein [Streptomyces albus]